MIKIYALTDMLYRLGFRKEAQSVYGLGDVVQTYEFEVDESEDSYTFDPGSLDEPMTAEESSEVTWVDDRDEDPIVRIERQSGELWEDAPLDKNHLIVQRLMAGFASLWELFLTGNKTVMSKELSKAALIFKYFDQDFKERRDRPNYIIQSGKAIRPEQALQIMSLSMREFLLHVPREQMRPRWIKELEEWAFGFYEEYADYYYTNVDSADRDNRLDIIKHRVDQNPTVTDDDEDYKRRLGEAQRKWEEAEAKGFEGYEFKEMDQGHF